MASRLIACTCWGARWVEDESSLSNAGCYACGSSAVAIEKNLKGEAEKIIQKHGWRRPEAEGDL